MTPEQRTKIRAIAEAATPGPWSWFGNTKVHSIYLATVERGRQFVMQFGRWGMSSAQPQFQQRDGRSGIMRDARDLVVYEAAHRKDFHDIDNPDARYIAAASPDVLLALLDEIDRLEAIVNAGCGRCANFVTDVDEQCAEGVDEGSNA